MSLRLAFFSQISSSLKSLPDMRTTWACLAISFIAVFFSVRTSLICAAIVIFIFAVLSKVVSWRRSTDSCHVPPDGTRISKLPPGRMGLPLVGETIAFLRTAWSGEFFNTREAKYGPVFSTHILGHPTIYVSGAENIKMLFAAEPRFLKTFWPQAMRMLLGTGGFATSSHVVHKHLKRRVAKAMHQLPQDFLHGQLYSVLKEHFKHWRKCKELDFYASAKVLTGSVACRALFGFSVDESDARMMADDLMILGNGFFSVPIDFPGTSFAKAQDARERLVKMLRSNLVGNHMNIDLIASRENEKWEGHVSDTSISLALELLFGGQETLSCAMTCAVMLLFSYPDVVEKIREEIKQNFKHANSFADKSCYDNLPYIDNVFKEIIRLYPPIGGGFRKAIETFEIGDYTVPKGWFVTYSIKSTHEQSTLYDDVTAFRPERWDKTAETSVRAASNYSYIPFGVGTSSCIGYSYVKTFMKVFLVQLIHNNNWEVLTKDPRLTTVPVLKPIGGLQVRFWSRTGE